MKLVVFLLIVCGGIRRRKIGEPKEHRHMSRLIQVISSFKYPPLMVSWLSRRKEPERLSILDCHVDFCIISRVIINRISASLACIWYITILTFDVSFQSSNFFCSSRNCVERSRENAMNQFLNYCEFPSPTKDRCHIGNSN